jgi:hypothetical protein
MKDSRRLFAPAPTYRSSAPWLIKSLGLLLVIGIAAAALLMSGCKPAEQKDKPPADAAPAAVTPAMPSAPPASGPEAAASKP